MRKALKLKQLKFLTENFKFERKRKKINRKLFLNLFFLFFTQILEFDQKHPERIIMPSDSKKREQQRKKDAQKKRNQKIATVGSSKDDEKPTNGTTNGDLTNGAQEVELTEEGTFQNISIVQKRFFVCGNWLTALLLSFD